MTAMKSHLRLILSLCAAAVLQPLLIAADRTPPANVAPIEVGSDMRDAWIALQAADVRISLLIAQSRLTDVAAQTCIVKESVGTILRGVRPPDESSLKRLVSAGREMIALADHLTEVAASGNRARAEIVHANLHRYVEFIQSKLSRGGASNSRSPVP